MVRYHEIIKEKPDTDEDIRTPKEITEQLMKEYCPNTHESYYTVNQDGTIDARQWVTIDPVNKIKRLPFTFNKIDRELRVTDNDLESFEGLPETVQGSLMFYNNKFKNLIGLPKYVHELSLTDNPIVSLEGLEAGYVQQLVLNWNSDLPLLRVVAHCKELRFNPTNGKGNQAAEIINEHNRKSVQQVEDEWNKIPANEKTNKDMIDNFGKSVKLFSKKCIYDCQYDLIKAGLKASARW